MRSGITRTCVISTAWDTTHVSALRNRRWAGLGRGRMRAVPCKVWAGCIGARLKALSRPRHSKAESHDPRLTETSPTFNFYPDKSAHLGAFGGLLLGHVPTHTSDGWQEPAITLTWKGANFSSARRILLTLVQRTWPEKIAVAWQDAIGRVAGWRKRANQGPTCYSYRHLSWTCRCCVRDEEQRSTAKSVWCACLIN